MTRVLISASPGLNRCTRLCRVEAKMLSCYGRVPNCGTDTGKSFLEYGKADRLYGKVGFNKVRFVTGNRGVLSRHSALWWFGYESTRLSGQVL
jgi:hypothetical protein